MQNNSRPLSIVLIALNARYTHSCPALYLLRESVADMPVAITILQRTIHEDPIDLARIILDHKPDAAGVSVSIWNARQSRRLLQTLRILRPQMPLVVGGTEITGNPESWINTVTDPLCVIPGYGESGFGKWCRSLIDQNPATGLLHVPSRPFAEVPFPYREADMDELKDRYIYYESSRGCPYRCSFCLSSATSLPLERRTLEQVLSELDFLISEKVRIVKFVDRTFNAPGGFHREIWQYLLNNPNAASIRFHFEIRPDILTEEDFQLLETVPAGRFQFEIGIQTIHPDERAAVDRGGDWELEQANISRLIGLGTIPVHLDFIAGLPEQTIDKALQSINAMLALKPNHFQLGFLKVLPGTPLAREADSMRLRHLSGPPYTILETPWMRFEELAILERIEAGVRLFWNPQSFRFTMAALLRRFRRPSDLMQDLSAFLLLAGFPLKNMSWIKLAKLVAEYIHAHCPDNVETLMDSLRLDWLFTTTAHRPPEWLASCHGDAIASQARRILRGRFPKARIAVFVPVSRELTAHLKEESLAICSVRTPEHFTFYGVSRDEDAFPLTVVRNEPTLVHVCQREIDQ